jgi:putative membrane protein
MDMMDGAGWAMGLGGWLWMALGLVLVLALVWALAAGLSGGRPNPTDDAARILAERFARGELSEQEYQQARRLLGVR